MTIGAASILVVLLAAAACHADDVYILGQEGESCLAACGAVGRNCRQDIVTNDSTDVFKSVGVDCKTSDNTSKWWAPDQPSLVIDPHDPNYGLCVGWKSIPAVSSCQGHFWSVKRLCRCGDDNTQDDFFGTGYSGGEVDEHENVFFAHNVESGSMGVMTHFWTTAPQAELVTFRYYVDGETTASIEFQPGMACGVGFGDTAAPWGTKWFGLGAGNGHGTAYTLNFQIPFQKSIVVTAQANSTLGGFYMIVRGAKNKQISIGGYNLPSNSRLILQKFTKTVQPLEYVVVTDVPSGGGMHFMSTLAVSSGNLNFLEGCYHAYSPYNQSFPGTVISTGTEDYFDSGWYFNAGEFHFPVSGFTHFKEGETLTWSAYRFHEMDPLIFRDGFRLQWRNGDMNDPVGGLKCWTQSGGEIVGNPTVSNVTSYAWVYVW